MDDILGDLEEIVGDYGFDETVGTALAPMPRSGVARPGTAVLPDGRRVSNRKYSKSRIQVLPLSSPAAIAAGASSTFSTRPQCLFRAERWVVQDAAGAFTIQDLKIGKNSQLLNSGSVPSAVFGAGAFGVRLKCDTAAVAMDISTSVTNTSGAAASFVSALIGPSIE